MRNVVFAKNFTTKNSNYFSRTFKKMSKVENLLLFYSKISSCFVKRTNILYEINTKNPSFKGFYQMLVMENEGTQASLTRPNENKNPPTSSRE